MRSVWTGIVVACSVACSGDGGTGISSINGPWTLRTVNGAPLPFTITEAGTGRTELVDDVLTLYVGGTYAESGHVRMTTGGEASMLTREQTGSYTTFGTSITLRSSDGTVSRVATISGNTMTFVEPGVTMVFTK